MRKRFEQQIRLGERPIGEVFLNPKSRHELLPVLTALQYIFTTSGLNERVFKLLEEKITAKKNKTGRPGLSLWEILVLSTVRLNLDIDYDFLLDQANNHKALRGIMGLSTGIFDQEKTYQLQTLKDNVALLDEETIRSINALVVEAGHNLLKKKEKEVLDLQVKMDSFVVEGNIHFPTDLNLLWDSGRKCLDSIDSFFEDDITIVGWRKRVAIRNQFKKVYRHTSEIHRKKGTNHKTRLEKSTKAYLKKARALSKKMHQSVNQLSAMAGKGDWSTVLLLRIERMCYYIAMLDKHYDLINRRILKGEKIPHSEKVFSIFEPHMEWISKGKLHKGVELGHNVVIATDQFQFILDYQVMIHQSDPEMGLLLANRMIENYVPHNQIYSMSFDRGFYSSVVKATLENKITEVIMPKPGKKSLRQREEESTDTFVSLRKAHSGVEANINQLEHNGLNRCPDKGKRGFEKYTGLGVLAYNLQHLGKVLLEQQKEKAQQLKQAA